MGRAEMLFAAGAIALAILAGAADAIASADPGDTPAGESADAGASDADQPKDMSVDQSTDDNAETYTGDNDRTAGEESGGGEDNAGGDADLVDEDSGNGDNRDGRTANRVPMWLPEVPADLGPLPDELPPLPLEPPLPPADLPPGEPDVVDVTMVGPGASPSEGNDSPVMKMPVIIAPPAPSGYILGTSITARGTLRPALTPPSRGPAEQPALRQPTTGLREPPITSAGVSIPQTANRIGVTKEGLPRVRLAETVAGALPGIGGIIVMTAAGVCLGHRQATAANQLRAHGLDRFLA